MCFDVLLAEFKVDSLNLLRISKLVVIALCCLNILAAVRREKFLAR